MRLGQHGGSFREDIVCNPSLSTFLGVGRQLIAVAKRKFRPLKTDFLSRSVIPRKATATDKIGNL